MTSPLIGCHSLFIDENMILDRSQSPDYQIIKSVSLPPIHTVILGNGLPLHVINIGEQPVVKIECLFEAGSWYEKKEAESFFATKMLQEGTASFTSSEISERLEKIGAFIELAHSTDKTGIVVYCLDRMLPMVLEVIQEMIFEATIPQKELDELKNITLQHLKVNEEKVSWVAGNRFREEIFGYKHPYGRFQSETQIAGLNADNVRLFYEQHLQIGPVCIFLSGKVGDKEIKAVEEVFGARKMSGNVQSSPVIIGTPAKTNPQTRTLVEKEDSVQSAIRVGKEMFTRQHPDYFKMQVVNEILGGYFGSRLMKNIREEKGLTYGISSMIYTFRHAGFLTIGTDVKREFTEQTINEIFKEIRLLQEVAVSATELQTVKNYMAGEFAGSLNTAFDIAEKRKILIIENLPEDFYEQYINAIHATTAEEIMELSQKHLAVDDMKVVVCGGY